MSIYKSLECVSVSGHPCPAAAAALVRAQQKHPPLQLTLVRCFTLCGRTASLVRVSLAPRAVVGSVEEYKKNVVSSSSSSSQVPRSSKWRLEASPEVLQVISAIRGGADVQATLQPFFHKIPSEEWNKVVGNVGELDWALAFRVFRVLESQRSLSASQMPNLTRNDGADDDDGRKEARVRLLKAYTTMGAVLARHGREGEIESLVEEMEASGLHPDVFFYNAIARGYGNQGLVLPASRLLLQMEKHGVQPNNTTYERVIAACLSGDTPNVDKAVQLLRGLRASKSVVGYKPLSNLLTACWLADRVDDADLIFEDMLAADYKIDNKVWMKMMQLHGRKGRHRRVENIFQKMREAGLEAKGGEYDALLLSYCRAGLFDQALSVFREYKLKTKPSLVAYNMLIDACGKKGMHEEAVRFYVEVMEAGYHPTSVTYTSLIAAVAQGGRYEKAEELYRRMLRDGVKPTSHTFATMINAYSLRGWTKAGHEVCSDVLKSSGGAVNVKVYGAMLNLYVRGGWYSHAADIFNEMQRNNVEPDAAGYGVLISALGEMDNATIAPLAKALEGSQFELCRVAYHIICSPPPAQDSSSGTNLVSEGSLDGLLQPEVFEHDSVVQEVSDFLEIYTSEQDDKSNFSFYNAILDALWKRGLKQRAKIMMLKARSLSDQYNRPHFGESVWSLDLRGLSIRAAQVAVYNFLDETVKRAKMRTILAQKVAIKTGGSGTDEDVYVGQGKGTGVVRQVVFNSLIEMGAPFSEGLDQESLMSLQAPFEELVKWITRHKYLIQLNDSLSPSLSETGL